MTALGAPAAAAPPAPPAGLALAMSRLSRQLKRWTHRVRSALGIRRGLKVRGAYFKELSAESLQRALSRKGRGWKDYRVTFPDGSKQIIRCSAQRIFDDLMGPLGYDAGQGQLVSLLDIIRPGSRLLIIQAGTGAAAAWLGAAVGTSGAVVALEEDEQSVKFATRRYPRHHISFERGSVEQLAGEIDASFDGAVILRPLDAATRDAALLEIWRVVVPGGWTLVACTPGQGAHVAHLLRQLPAGDAASIRSTDGGGPDLVFATKASDDAPPASSQRKRTDRNGPEEPVS